MSVDNTPVKHGRAEALTRIFEDTQDWYGSDPALKQSIEASIAGTVLYPAGAVPKLAAPRFSQPMSVSVSRRRTLEAALSHLRREPDANVTVLNFASAAHGTDILILGAFGCGAFRNPPSVVARAYRELLDQFDGYLRRVEFAVHCSARDSRNYEAFQAAMR